MARRPGSLTIWLIGDKNTGLWMTSSRLGTFGDISEAAIFRSEKSAEKGLRQAMRHIREYRGHPFEDYNMFVEDFLVA